MSRQTAAEPRPASPIAFRPAAAAWAVAWLGGVAILGGLVIVASGVEQAADTSIPVLGLSMLVGWIAFGIALVVVSQRSGTGRPIADYALDVRPIDAAGIPLGVATQFALVPVLYWPLRRVWPDTFARELLEERAQDLADRAVGWHAIVLVVLVVVGAPIVEELVYRGLLQRSLANAVPRWWALVVTSAWFAFIHFAWVELPGLFAAGLVFGACVVITGRLGMAIATHAAFNAAGVAIVLWAR